MAAARAVCRRGYAKTPRMGGSRPCERCTGTASTSSQPALKAMREGVLRGLEFTGITPRADFWWFALAVVMLLAFAELLAGVVGPLPLQIATLLVLLPWIAACARRLRDAGLSPWCSSSAWRRWGASWCCCIY